MFLVSSPEFGSTQNPSTESNEHIEDPISDSSEVFFSLIRSMSTFILKMKIYKLFIYEQEVF